jgi:hypothetical protein
MDNEQSPNSDQDIQGLISQMQPDSASRFGSGTQAAAPSGKEPAAGEDSDVTALMGNMTPESRSTFGGAPSPRASISGPIVQSKTTPIKTAPKLFHTAGTPAPELSWSQAFEGAGKSLLPSTGQGIGTMVSALAHPIDTATSLGKLGQGALSKTAGWLGAKQDEKQKADTEGSFNALLDHYKNVYGSTKGFKQALNSDPFSLIMDAATVGSLGTLAPETTAGKALSLVSKIDPIQAALSVAGKVAKVPVTVLRGTQSGLSGVDYNALKMAHEVGATGTASQRAGYKAGLSGNYDASKIADRLDTAADAARRANSAEYLSGKSNLVNATPDYSGINNEIAAQRNNVKYSSGANAGFKTTHDAIDDAEKIVQGAQGGNPTILDQDTLKRSLYDLRNSVPSGAPRHAIDAIAASVKKSIVDIDPKYADIMDAYQTGLTAIKEFKGELGAGANVGDAKVLARALKSLKTDAKTDVLKRLAIYDPDLPYILAGYAAKDAFRGGTSGAVEAIASLGLWPLIHPAAAVGSLAMGSPKIAGRSQYMLGRAGKLGAAATSQPVTSGAYYGQRAIQEQEQQPSGDMSGGPSNASQDDQSLPKNVRNNNPGNIMDSEFAKRQPGYVGSDGKFAVFDKPENGYSAHKTLLSSYGSEGRDTIDAIINKWSPSNASGNTPESTEYYKSEVAKRLGIGIHDHLNMSDPNVLDALSKAMANFEGDKRAATGGRIGRASGGRIMNHKSEAESLIRLADKTKKALNNSTESLLAVPDEAVTKALSIANEAI